MCVCVWERERESVCVCECVGSVYFMCVCFYIIYICEWVSECECVCVFVLAVCLLLCVIVYTCGVLVKVCVVAELANELLEKHFECESAHLHRAHGHICHTGLWLTPYTLLSALCSLSLSHTHTQHTLTHHLRSFTHTQHNITSSLSVNKTIYIYIYIYPFEARCCVNATSPV